MPRFLTALFCCGMVTGLLIRGLAAGAIGKVEMQGDLAQMDSGLLSSRILSGAVVEVRNAISSAKVGLHDGPRPAETQWVIRFDKNGDVLDVKGK